MKKSARKLWGPKKKKVRYSPEVSHGNLKILGPARSGDSIGKKKHPFSGSRVLSMKTFQLAANFNEAGD